MAQKWAELCEWPIKVNHISLSIHLESTIFEAYLPVQCEFHTILMHELHPNYNLQAIRMLPLEELF
jgi:hypothetical protein